MDTKELDKILKEFERKHPIKKDNRRRVSLDNFIDRIETQLDNATHCNKR